MFYVYVLYCKNKQKLYYGYTNNLKRRLKEHGYINRSYSFTINEDFELAYYEAHVSEEDAKARERFLKTGWGRNYTKRILKNYLRSQS